MLSWDAAWRQFATPAERAVATASRRIPDSTVRAVIERAREHGAIVVTTSKTRKQKRARRPRR